VTELKLQNAGKDFMSYMLVIHNRILFDF